MSTHISSAHSRRALLVALAATGASGCFGGFNATRSLYGWNDSFDSKWIKWLIFLVLAIVPVYGLFILADVLVLNSIEFWSGKNPITVSESEDGRKVVRKATEQENLVRLEVYQDDELERVLHARRGADGRVALLDEQRRVLTEARTTGSGELQIIDRDGSVLLTLPAGQADAIAAAASDGASLHRAVSEALRVSKLEPERSIRSYL